MSSDLVIRPATPSDRPRIIKIFREINELHALHHPDVFRVDYDDTALNEMLEKREETADYELLVAEVDREVCGFIELRVVSAPPLAILFPRTWMEIDSLAVTNSMQRRGIGRALLDAADSKARELGISLVQLTVWESNADARAFYERIGFETRRRSLTREVS